jgi:predicted small lipoprotein YifL
MNVKNRSSLLLATVFAVGALAACERQGPLERFGEEVDETVDTVREGEESVATKVDDAVDELRD